MEVYEEAITDPEAWEADVIGDGRRVTALAAATYLVRVRRRVLLLEKADEAGGRLLLLGVAKGVGRLVRAELRVRGGAREPGGLRPENG